MNYSRVLKRAWEITWRYKFLWVFGFAMALCRGGGGGGNNFRMNRDFSGGEQPGGNLPNNFPFSENFQTPDLPPNIQQWIGSMENMTTVMIIIAAVLLFIIIVSLIGLAVVAISRSAIVRSVDRAEKGETINFSSAWKDGLAKALPVGLLELLLGIPSFILGLGIAAAIVYGVWQMFLQNGGNFSSNWFEEAMLPMLAIFVPIVCCLICLGIFLGIIVGIFSTFGSRAIVLEDKGVLASFSRAWQLFSANLGPSILIWLTLVVVGWVIGFVISVPFVLILMPAFMMLMVGGMLAPPALIGFIFLMLLIPVVASIFYGVFVVFSESLWTLAYRSFANLEKPVELVDAADEAAETTS